MEGRFRQRDSSPPRHIDQNPKRHEEPRCAGRSDYRQAFGTSRLHVLYRTICRASHVHIERTLAAPMIRCTLNIAGYGACLGVTALLGAFIYCTSQSPGTDVGKMLVGSDRCWDALRLGTAKRRNFPIGQSVKEFRQRMDMFDEEPHGGNGLPVSIKVRVTSGCFHRKHSPHAYRLIDEYLQCHAPEDARRSFQEHESGPELLVYLALTTAGLSLSAAIINVVTAIIKARADGIKKGDHPDSPLEIIVRGHHRDGEFYEEQILRVDSRTPLAREMIENAMNQGLKAIEEKKPPAPPSKPAGPKNKKHKKR